MDAIGMAQPSRKILPMILMAWDLVMFIFFMMHPLNRAAVGLKLLVFEIFYVPQKVLLGIVSIAACELNAYVVVVEVQL